jgi:hypothetical protein
MQRLNLKSFLRPHEGANNPETLRMWPSTCLPPSIDKFRESAWGRAWHCRNLRRHKDKERWKKLCVRK